MSGEINYIEEVCRLEKAKFAGTGLDGHLNGILAMLPSLRSQLAAALAERDEAREVNAQYERLRSRWKSERDKAEQERDKLAAECGDPKAYFKPVRREYIQDINYLGDASTGDHLAAQLNTAWQQGAEATREAAIKACNERAAAMGSMQCQYAGDDIRALPVPERKEG